MTAIITIAGLLMGWAMLRVIGGERDRRLQELQARIEDELAAQAETPDTPPAQSPVRSKAGR